MVKTTFYSVIFGMIFLSTGCVNHKNFAYPTYERATPEVEARRVQQYDPYPDPNIAPPVPGVRPHGYEIPADSRVVIPRTVQGPKITEQP